MSSRPWSFLLLLVFGTAQAQQTATVSGTVRTSDLELAEFVNVAVMGSSTATSTDPFGRYSLVVPAGEAIRLRFSQVSTDTVVVVNLAPGERRTLNMVLGGRDLSVHYVRGTERGGGIERINPRVIVFNPSITGGIESMLGSMGANVRNELSSGYSVRGGNYDENLVYVNDIEVMRPFLVRAGQQEGLSFPNPDMVERIQFSAGGFDARYGDKLSSVLDIQYKRPKKFAATVTASTLGGAISVENAMMNKRLRQVTGFRYRSTELVLRGLDTQGEYDPRYTDLQSYWTFDISDKVEATFLGLYSRNKYVFEPQDRETELGNFNEALRFTVYYDGIERTEYETFSGTLGLNVKPRPGTILKFYAGATDTRETERFDILGQYLLSELERDLGSDQFGEAVRNLGIGTFLDHARNELNARMYTVAHKGVRTGGRSILQWGIDARSERINDRLSEWSMVDSADYSIPYSGGENLELQYSLKTRLNIESIRSSAYLQNSWEWRTGADSSGTLGATLGVRAQNWSYNGQTVVSPRGRIKWQPGWKRVTAKGDTVSNRNTFWFATGYYYQPPFYRELRGIDGQLNPDLKAQESIHFVLGWDRNFTFWDRPFKFSAEAYYKVLNNLIPYEVDNVRIRYYATNNSKGQATGLDLKLNGEFIEGIESWVSLGLLSVQEDITDDFYYDRYNADGQLIVPGYTFDQVAVDSVLREPGSIPRPTDQRFNFALFFQDEMPRWPTWKVHVNLVLGSGLPFGPPSFERYKDTLRTSFYRRVDIGFSKQFVGGVGQREKWMGAHDLWLSLEVFNLLNVNNVVDHTWVQDVRGRYYAIPDFLSPRRFNLKLVAWF